MKHPLAALSDTALINSLKVVLGHHRHSAVSLILHLGEVEERKLFAGAGYSSMFGYCTKGLGMYEGTAVRRLGVARTARRFPLVLELLSDGRIHQSGVGLLAKHLTEENHEAVLLGACGRSKTEIERMVADLAPKPDVKDSIRKCAGPARRPAVPSPAAPAENGGAALFVSRDPAPEPLGGERYKVRFTASAALREKIEKAQALMGHRVDDGDLGALFEAALDVLLDKVEKERFAVRPKTKRVAAKKANGGAASRHIPNPIRRAVHERDGGRCAFRSADGHRCGERKRVEFHHRVAWAKGGRHTVENIQLLCRTHNRWEADGDFGVGFMARKIAARRG